MERLGEVVGRVFNDTDWSSYTITYEWKIKNFLSLSHKTGEYLTSPPFNAGHNGELWCLRLYPRGRLKKDEEHVSLYLHLLSSDTVGIEITACFSMFHLHYTLGSAEVTVQYSLLFNHGFDFFLPRESMAESHKNSRVEDSVTIRCTMKVPSAGITYKGQLASFHSQKKLLCEDLGDLLKNPEFADIKVTVDNQSFPAHRSILAARSPVFAAMFKHNELKENLEKEVKIEKMEANVVKGMLEYIYAGETKDIEKLAGKLLVAADRYELEGLKLICEKTLHKNLNAENAVETLEIASLYRVVELKKHTLDFIKENFPDIASSESFNNIEDVELLKDLMKIATTGSCFPVIRIGNWGLFNLFIIFSISAYFYGKSQAKASEVVAKTATNQLQKTLGWF